MTLVIQHLPEELYGATKMDELREALIKGLHWSGPIVLPPTEVDPDYRPPQLHTFKQGWPELPDEIDRGARDRVSGFGRIIRRL